MPTGGRIEGIIVMRRSIKTLPYGSNCYNKVANKTNMVKGRPLKDIDIGASGGLCRAEHSNMTFSDIIGISFRNV